MPILKLYDPDLQSLRFSALSSVDPSEKLLEEVSQLSRGMTGYVFRTRMPYRSADVRQEPKERYHVIFPDTVSKSVVPLLGPEEPGKDNCYGVLAIDGREKNQFGADTQEMLMILGKQAAVSIEQSRRFSEVGTTYQNILTESRTAQEVLFVRNIVHDAKNMVRGVVSELEDIHQELRETPFGRKRAAELEQRTKTLKDMNDLMALMLARLKRPVADHDSRKEDSSVDLLLLAKRAMAVVPSTDVKVELELAGDAKSYVVYGSETKLLTVFYNLLANAAVAIKQSKRPGKITVTLSDSPKRKDYRRVTITDDGPGLARSVLNFIRKGEKYSGIPGGSGLGLLTVRENITELGGTITVDSKFGAGTTFTMELRGPERG